MIVVKFAPLFFTLKLLRSDTRYSPDLLSSKSLQPHLNYTAFRNTGYAGLTGEPLLLTENGDEAATVIFQYFNYSQDTIFFGYTNVEQTKFQYADLKMETFLTVGTADRMLFFGGGHIPPPDGPIYTTDMLDSTSGKGLTIEFLSFLGLAAAICLSILVIIYRRNNIIKSGSVVFLSVLSLGSIPAYASLLLSLNNESILKCTLRLWLQLSSYSIILGCLIVKNFRVWMVYSAKKKISKVFLWDSSMLAFLGFFVTVEMVLLGIFSKASQLRLKTEILHNIIQTTCVNNEDSRRIGIALWVYNSLLLVMLIAVTCLCRNVGPNHSESTLLSYFIRHSCVFCDCDSCGRARHDIHVAKCLCNFSCNLDCHFSTHLFNLIPKAVGIYRRE
ncbi:hypothetical protein BDR26DRAFT_453871 [Obelidium mucronatum]|nr:hypothetical protein BDR26DRAFT_453871 [Obelidium mucronatum]